MSAPTTVRLAPARVTAARPRHPAGARTESGPPGARRGAGTVPAPPRPPAPAPDAPDVDDGITEHLRCPLRTDPLDRAAPPSGARPGVGLSVEPDMASAMVALAAVEVLDGDRQQAQLARWLLPEVYDTLSRRAALTTHHAALLRSARRDGPSNAFPPGLGGHLLDTPAAAATAGTGRDEMVGGLIRAHGTRPVVRRLRMCRIDEDTVESSVVVVHARRVRAVAVRLIRLRGRWRASALVIG
jgi:hypothetical protein